MNHVILTASFLVPLILSVVLLYNARSDKAKRIMGWSMVNAALVFIANYYYFLDEFEIYQYLHSLHVALVLFIYPSIFIYILYLTQQQHQATSVFLHFLPGFFFFLLYLIFFDFRFTVDERITYLTTYRGNGIFTSDKFWLVNIIRVVNVLAIIVGVVFYSVSILRLTYKYNKRLGVELSNADDYKIGWLSKANIALIVVAIVSVVFYVLDPFSQENNNFLILSMFLMSIFIWLMGIFGNAQKYVELPILDNTEIKEGLGDVNNDLFLRIKEYIIDGKLYKQNDLRLDELARSIGTNRSYLSRAINQAAGINFNQFVNQFRIKEAQDLLQENNGLKMEFVALEVGFGSVSSFRRAFIQTVGTTPEQWLKKNSNK